MPGSSGLVDASTASTTHEPLWRTTSRWAVTPPGSSTWSRVTQKTLPLNGVLDDRTLALPVNFFGLVSRAAGGGGTDSAGAVDVFAVFGVFLAGARLGIG